MLPTVSATALDVWVSGVLAVFSQAGTVLVVGFFLTTAILAMRCDGCCSKDEIFRRNMF